MSVCKLACVLALSGATALQFHPATLQGSETRLSSARPALKRTTSLVAAAAAEDEGQAGLPASTANLVKSIVGSGVLSYMGPFTANFRERVTSDWIRLCADELCFA